MRNSWRHGRLGQLPVVLALIAALAPNLVGVSAIVVRAADYAVPSFNVVSEDYSEVRPSLGGNQVVWQDYKNNPGAPIVENANADVRRASFGADEASEKINEGSNNTKRPATDGATIVWTQDDGATGLNIRGYSIASDDHVDVETGTGDQDFADVSGDRVVYQDDRSGNWDINGYSIDGDDHFNVEDQGDEQIHPRIDGSLVCWEDYRDGASDPNIFCRDVDSGDSERVTDTGDATWPDVSGKYVVYVRGSSGDQSIYVYNHDDGTKIKISTPTNRSRTHPRISGDIVVWQDERSGSGQPDIWGYDIATGEEFPVNSQDDDQADPAIAGNNIAWTDDSHLGDIRGGLLELIGAATETSAPSHTGATPAPGVCSFELGFKALHDLIPEIVGDCAGNENFERRTGNAVQATTRGLMVWRKADNWTAFTDGSRTWINGPCGLQDRANSEFFPWEQGGSCQTTPAPPKSGIPASLQPAMDALTSTAAPSSWGFANYGEVAQQFLDQSGATIMVADLPEGTMGLYSPRDNTVTISPIALRDIPNATAAVLFHELRHSWQSVSDPNIDCLHKEVDAYVFQSFFWGDATHGALVPTTDLQANLNLVYWTLVGSGEPGLYHLVVDSPSYQQQCSLWVPN